jgi:hypothetical protein
MQMNLKNPLNKQRNNQCSLVQRLGEMTHVLVVVAKNTSSAMASLTNKE